MNKIHQFDSSKTSTKYLKYQSWNFYFNNFEIYNFSNMSPSDKGKGSLTQKVNVSGTPGIANVIEFPIR